MNRARVMQKKYLEAWNVCREAYFNFQDENFFLSNENECAGFIIVQISYFKRKRERGCMVVDAPGNPFFFL